MNLKDLTKELEYKMRKGPGGTELAYIDARQVMDLLDEVVGPENWQCDYKGIGDKIYCGIAILVDDKWVWKWDMGVESDFEAEKGEASDAFKRAAVKWGIGRFLYSLPTKKTRPTSTAKPAPKPPVKKTSYGSDGVLDAMEQALFEVDQSKCKNCGKAVPENVRNYSMDKYGEIFCYKHQPR